MILPVEAKAKAYSAYFKKLIMNQSGSDYTYRDLGLTYIAPDDETIEKMTSEIDAKLLEYENNHKSGTGKWYTVDDMNEMIDEVISKHV